VEQQLSEQDELRQLQLAIQKLPPEQQQKIMLEQLPQLTPLQQQELLKQIVQNHQQEKYKQLTQSLKPKPPLRRNIFWAFVVGGLICTLGQAVLNFFSGQGMSPKEAAAATSAVMIFLGAFFTGLGLYDKLGAFAGAGSIVPITGFANSIVSPAMEFKREGYVLGVGAKMFTVAGPVIVYGTFAAFVVGLIAYLLR